MNFSEIEELRPYNDSEVNAALNRITRNPIFKKVLDFLFPIEKHQEITDAVNQCKSAVEFQKKFMYHAVRSVTSKTSSGLSWTDVTKLRPDVPYLFIGNHRDIVLDSAILQTVLVDYNIPTTEITFGSNLMTLPIVVDIGKSNRMFKVVRGSNPKELLKNSRILSEYIQYTLTEKKVSIWIAQRNGRTKDGNDRTDVGLVKMLNMSGKDDIVSNLKLLNIVPYAISYEFEPCCAEKINELYISRYKKYEKKPGEDMASVVKGIMQPKGRIHLSFNEPLVLNEDLISSEQNKNEVIRIITQAIDNQIYKNFRLFPNNYIAYDILTGKNKYSEQYSVKEKSVFMKYKQDTLSNLQGNLNELSEIFFQLYANPVLNLESSLESRIYQKPDHFKV